MDNHKLEKKKLVFVTTYTNSNCIYRFLDSVFINNSNFSVLILLLEQGGLNLNFDRYISKYTQIKVIRIQEFIGISTARNIVIEFIKSYTISFNHIMFPDDDSTFTKEFFLKYDSVVNDSNCYLIDVFFEQSSCLYRPNKISDLEKLTRKHYKYSMSVNLLISYSIFIKVGDFDEEMGVGSFYGAAEDSDYFLRCLKSGAVFYYSKKLYNYHPNFDLKYENLSVKKLCYRFKGYGMGVEYLYRKHGMYYEGLKLLLRAIGGGLFSLINGKFKLSIAYIYSFYYRLLVLCKIL